LEEREEVEALDEVTGFRRRIRFGFRSTRAGQKPLGFWVVGFRFMGKVNIIPTEGSAN
jgi:hypothetical protein